jgi:hypothetical protein
LPTNTPTPTNTPLPPTATPTNTPLPPTATPTATPVASGNFGLGFDGVDDVVTGPSLPSTGPLTIELWLRPAQSGASYVIAAQTDENSGWSLELNNGRLTFWLAANQVWRADQLTPVALQANQWYHIAATYDGSRARTFVSGAASAGTNVGALTQGPNLLLGGFPGYGNVSGQIDEMRISNIVRYTGAYAVPTAPFVADANTLLLWSLDTGSGQTVYDESSNANNGTLGNNGQVNGSDPVWVPGYNWPGGGN